MDNTYFPHYGEDITRLFDYNIMPGTAIAGDPRMIASEWSDDALKTLSMNEVYVGQKIFSQDDRKTHTCIWVPGKGTYSGYNCLWKTEGEWIDVSTYTPDTQKIEENEATKWKYFLNQQNTYCGFYSFESTDFASEIAKPAVLNDMLDHTVEYSDTKNQDYISGSYMARQTLVKTKDVSVMFQVGEDNVPSIGASAEALGGRFVVIAPATNRGDAKARKVKYVQHGSETDGWAGEFTKVSDVMLQSVNSVSYEMEDCKFDVYVSDWVANEDFLTAFAAGTKKVRITFTKIEG